mmetsp:Transcript_10115/g.29946  ORF Transcript_10115/g.29946 Transcript_10115/m.29946 type:complete len:262 (+) Transcript_10115:194-979(+)
MKHCKWRLRVAVSRCRGRLATGLLVPGRGFSPPSASCAADSRGRHASHVGRHGGHALPAQEVEERLPRGLLLAARGQAAVLGHAGHGDLRRGLARHGRHARHLPELGDRCPLLRWHRPRLGTLRLRAQGGHRRVGRADLRRRLHRRGLIAPLLVRVARHALLLAGRGAAAHALEVAVLPVQEDLDVAAAHPLAAEDAPGQLRVIAAAHLHEGLPRRAAVAAAEEVDSLGVLADAVDDVVLAEEVEDVLLRGAEGEAAEADR